MKTIMKVLVAAFLVGLAASTQAQGQELTPEQAAQVIAQVGDEVITAGEFARDIQFKVRQIEQTTGQKVNPDLRFRRALLTEVINSRILGIVARNAGTPVSEEELEKEFQERKGVFDSEEAYQGYLKRLNMTEAALKENIRSRLRVKNFVDQKTGELIAADEEIAKAYETLKAEGKMNRKEKTRDIAVMLLRAKGGSDEDWRGAEERANAARARVLAGESFEAVARELSEDPSTAPRGGVLREMKIGSFYPELETAMSALKSGDVSAPVRSVMGWYVITILAENEPGIVPIESGRDILRDQVIEGKRRDIILAIVEDAQKLIRVELLDQPAPTLPAAPAEPLTPPVPLPPAPDVPLPSPEPAPAPGADTPVPAPS
jgi:parvulin-like peptidyl-prolyl isomerase